MIEYLVLKRPNAISNYLLTILSYGKDVKKWKYFLD